MNFNRPMFDADCDSAKHFRGGTHRIRSPRETVDGLRPHMEAMGITRVADVTGLDRIGIPVVMVCRPNARSLAVSQGKGVDLAAATASGLMESVEQYHAEHIDLPRIIASYRDLRANRRVARGEDLPRYVGSRYSPDLALPWIEGLDLLSGEPCWVPYDLVHLDYRMSEATSPWSQAFSVSSNGLASGNHLLEVISHGICEVVERDALTLWSLRSLRDRATTRLDLDTIDDPVCQDLLHRFQEAGIAVAVWDMTSDIGMACFRCIIAERDSDPLHPLVGGSGYGCHPAPNVALLRALTECAQTRLSYISGSRDDIHRHEYQRLLQPSVLEAGRVIRDTPVGVRSFADTPDRQTDSIQRDVAGELERLHEVGIESVVVVDLTKVEFGIPVARVIIPGLEFDGNAVHTSSAAVGWEYHARARRILRQREMVESLVLGRGFTPPKETSVPSSRSGPGQLEQVHPDHQPGVPNCRVDRNNHRCRIPSAADVYVFTGPTISAGEASAYLDAVYLPPVSQGDVYRATQAGARAIGIVDGYFEQVPAVWHKEILWAMARGVHVFGGASMGALRGAELHAFGMEGVGLIFNSYRDGVLMDDDEVALLHAPAEMGFRPTTEALVDIRATLDRARDEEIIGEQTRQSLTSLAKSLFYPDRTYPEILRRSRESGISPPELHALETWLPTGRVQQKRADAIAMLLLMQQRLHAGPKRVSYHFEDTLIFRRANAPESL